MYKVASVVHWYLHVKLEAMVGGPVVVITVCPGQVGREGGEEITECPG